MKAPLNPYIRQLFFDSAFRQEYDRQIKEKPFVNGQMFLTINTANGPIKLRVLSSYFK